MPAAPSPIAELSAIPLDRFAGCFFRRRFGAVSVTALCDGHMGIPLAAFPSLSQAEAEALARRLGLDPAGLTLSVSAFALQTNGRTWLVDAGTGNARGETAGHLPKALKRAGIEMRDVDVVLMTHMHVDHAAGLFLDDKAVFPNAELWLTDTELDFWTGGDRLLNKLQQTQLPYNKTALRLYADRIRTYPSGAEIAPGIVSVPLPGHTPGMTGFLVGDDSGRVLIWADVVHLAAFQCPRPDLSIRFDVDPAQAARTRIGCFERAIAEDLTVAGAHVPFPGFASIDRDGEAYRFRPHTPAVLLRRIARDGGADASD